MSEIKLREVQTTLLKPELLRCGSDVMLISPASGLANIRAFRHRVDKGIAALRQMGFNVIIGENARDPDFTRAGTIDQRVADIHAGFKNPQVKALIAMVGGSDVAAELLTNLDFELIKANPKVFMGYSDIGSLLLGIHKQTGLVTFHGPCVVTELGEYPHVFDYTVQGMRRALMNAQPIGSIEDTPEYTDEFLDWSQQLDRTRPRAMQRSNGWQWLQGGQAKGALSGGCIQTLTHMLKHYPKFVPNFSGSILFLESSEKEIGKGWPPEEVMTYLKKLKAHGIFDDIVGLVIGRPYKYNEKWHDEFINNIGKLGLKPNMPIVYNVPIGHTDPMTTLPIGASASLNSLSKQFSINEAAVRA